MKFKSKLDKPIHNNRIYPSDVFETAIEVFLASHPEGIPVFLGNNEDLNSLIGYATPCDGKEEFEIETIINSKILPLLQYPDTICLVSSSYGIVENGVVTEMKLERFNVVPKEKENGIN